jgi:aspartate kinase
MIVAKFGGGLLDSAEGLARVRDEILRLPRPVLIVASAFSQVTNRLEAIAQSALASEHDALSLLVSLVEDQRAIARSVLGSESFARWQAEIDPIVTRLDELVRGLAIVHELSARTLDLAVSAGERLASATLVAALREAGGPAIALSATDLIITDNRHRFARPNIELTAARVRERLRPLLDGEAIVVTEGYIARSISGETTTMGRESSNYSATLLGQLTGASEVWIYAAVPGILTADPALVPDARTLEHLSYPTARTLAELGAKILHPRTVTPVEEAGIPLVIRSLDGASTRIDASSDGDACSIVLLPDSSLISAVAPAVSSSEEAFVRELSERAPLVWRTRFRRRMQFVTASRVRQESIPVHLLEAPSVCVTIEGAVVSLVRESGIDGGDLAAFFGALGDRTPLAILGGIERHAIGAFVEGDDAHRLVDRLHEQFVGAGVAARPR